VITGVFQVFRPVSWLWLAFCLATLDGLADTIRVTTWNLQPMSAGAGTNGAPDTKQLRLAEASAVMKKLDPDVILLQQVRDWKMCEQLVQALKPADYRVLVCSAFPETPTGASDPRQVAILAKQRAYFSWSQPWEAERGATNSGGFVFAALQMRGQRVGLFSVESRDEPAAARQLLSQVAAIRDWVTNRVQVFVVGGTFETETPRSREARPETIRRLEAAGFADGFQGVSAAKRITRRGKAGRSGTTEDYILTQPQACTTNAYAMSSPVAEHQPVTCDLEVDPEKISAAWAALSGGGASNQLSPPSETGLATTAPASPTGMSRASNRYPPLAAVLTLGGALSLSALVWVWLRRSRRSGPRRQRLLPAQAEGGSGTAYTVVFGTSSHTGVVAPDGGAASRPQPIIHIEAPGTTETHAEILRQRTLAAEERAERATAALRTGLLRYMSQWLRQKLFRKLIADRAQLLEAQHAATEKAMTVEERLARVEFQIQQQNSGYQQRIEELSRELMAAKEENRELIRAQIRQVKAEMEAARARLLAQAEERDRG